MKREAAEVLRDALALPVEARAALAGSLFDSLDTEVDEDAEAEWTAEVSRRVAELDNGAIKTIPWTEVRRRRAETEPRVLFPSRVMSLWGRVGLGVLSWGWGMLPNVASEDRVR